MKYLCPDCERLVTPAATRLEDQQILLECPKCGCEETLSQGASPAASEPAGDRSVDRKTPSDTKESPGCPKCGGPRGERSSCDTCGLVFERWDPDGGGAAPELLQSRWEVLKKAWADESLHDSFVQECLAGDALGFAARCYKGRDDAVAERQLEKVAFLATQVMKQSTTPTSFASIARLAAWIVFAVCVLGLAFVFAYGLR